MGHSKGSPQREVHSNTALPKKIETFQTNNLTLRLQQLEDNKNKDSPEQAEGRK